MEILTTREWATVIWAFIVFFYAMAHKQSRESFREVVKIFFGSKLRILWSILLLYVVGITLIFYQLPFWENAFIKDITLWFIFSGLVCCMNAVSKEANEEYIKKVLKDNLKLTLVLEFILSTFTFNIWIELLIIPITTIIIMVNVIAEHQEEYAKVHKLLDIILAVAGFWILYETIKIGIHEYKELDALNTCISFMIPIVYSILIIPLEYIFELYSKYEKLFIRMSLKEEKGRKIQRRHRWLVINVCNLSVHKVLLFQKKYRSKMYSCMSGEEFEKMIEEFKNECNLKN